MTDSLDDLRPQGNPRAWTRSRRWVVVIAAIGLVLLVLSVTSGYLDGKSALLPALVILGVTVGVILPSLGIGQGRTGSHRLARRPWRSGNRVFAIALRHLPEVFLIASSRTRLAPSVVDLHLHPANLASLTERIDIPAAEFLATEAYRNEIAAHAAVVDDATTVIVHLREDAEIPLGRYRLAPRKVTNPLLRLVTGSRVAETRKSGASVGRSRKAELVLPNEPVISRVHAKLTCTESQWQVVPLGLNGLMLNDMPLASAGVLHDGDVIRWGRGANAPVSMVEIRP